MSQLAAAPPTCQTRARGPPGLVFDQAASVGNQIQWKYEEYEKYVTKLLLAEDQIVHARYQITCVQMGISALLVTQTARKP